MKIKTSEATGLQLDWGVAVATNKTPFVVKDWGLLRVAVQGGGKYFDHAAPAVCMGLIEQYKPDVVYRAEQWGVEFPHNNNQFWSSSLSQAVARCVIAMKLGDEFEVPDELGVMS